MDAKRVIQASAALLPVALVTALTSASAARPRADAVVTSPPTLNWKGVPAAELYNVQVWRDGRKILSRLPTASKLDLRSHWMYRDRRIRFLPGLYRWYVWPWLGRRYGRLQVNSSFSFVRPPRNVAAPALSGEAREGMRLVAARGTWRGTGPFEFAYRWQSCDAEGCVTIPGASNSTHVVRSGAIDRQIRVVVTATNRARSVSAASAQTGIVLAAPPANTTRPRIHGARQQGRTLRGSSGRWRSSRALTFRFQWLRCEANGRSCAPVVDAERSRYATQRADFERSVVFEVTAVNSGGQSGARSHRTPPIGRVYEGGEGNNVLTGSIGADVLRGHGGADTLEGRAGPDLVRGGSGNDRLLGGRGADRLFSRDRLWDAVGCGPGRDVVIADPGDEVGSGCERVRRR